MKNATSQSILSALELCTNLLHMREIFFSLDNEVQKKNILSDAFGTQKALENLSRNDPEAILAVHSFFVNNDGTAFTTELAKRMKDELVEKTSTKVAETKEVPFENQVW